MTPQKTPDNAIVTIGEEVDTGEGHEFVIKGNWVRDIQKMHEKFGVNPVIRTLSPEHLGTFLKFRIDFLQEELDELRKAEGELIALRGKPVTEKVKAAAIQACDDIVDALVDLCVVGIGTLDALDIEENEAWGRVRRANMAKSPGKNPSRPNPLGLPDMIKPKGWTAPSHSDNIGLLPRIAGL